MLDININRFKKNYLSLLRNMDLDDIYGKKNNLVSYQYINHLLTDKIFPTLVKNGDFVKTDTGYKINESVFKQYIISHPVTIASADIKNYLNFEFRNLDDKSQENYWDDYLEHQYSIQGLFINSVNHSYYEAPITESTNYLLKYFEEIAKKLTIKYPKTIIHSSGRTATLIETEQDLESIKQSGTYGTPQIGQYAMYVSDPQGGAYVLLDAEDLYKESQTDYINEFDEEIEK